MAPHTRKSQRLLSNQTPGALNETHASLKHSMHGNTTNVTFGVIGQDTNVQCIGSLTLPQTNLIGGSNMPKSDLTQAR